MSNWQDPLQDIQTELQQERNEHQQDQSKIDELQRADLQLRKAHADVLARKEQEIRQHAIEYHQLADKADISPLPALPAFIDERKGFKSIACLPSTRNAVPRRCTFYK